MDRPGRPALKVLKIQETTAKLIEIAPGRVELFSSRKAYELLRESLPSHDLFDWEKTDDPGPDPIE
jgi:hypothetical protein